MELVRLDLLHLLIAIHHANSNLLRRIALVGFEVQVNRDLADFHFAHKLNVDEVREGPKTANKSGFRPRMTHS